MENKLKILKSNAFKLTLKSLVSILLLFFIFRFIGINKFYNELANANLYYIAISVFFGIFQIFFKAIRWNTIIRVFNKSISLSSSLIYTLIAHAFGIATPGRVGEFIKVKYLVDNSGMGYVKSFMTVLIDKVFDTATVILFILFGLSFLREEIFFSGYSTSALAVYIIILILIYVWLDKILGLINKFLPNKYKNSFKKLSITRGVYIKSFLFSIFIWLILSVQAFFVIKALNVQQVPFYAFIVIVPLMALSSMIPISIGGIGIREIVAVSFLLLLGIPAEKSAIFSLLNTFITFGVPAIIGAFLYSGRKIN